MGEEEEEDNFQLTDDQTADFRDAFKKFDAAGEGEIPTSELGTVMKMLGHKLNDEELEECIKMVDADGGGSVDIDEFLTEADLKDLISEIDSDGSGWVDYDEFKALM